MVTMERKVLQEFIEIYHNEQSLWKIKSCHYNNKTIKNAAYRRLLYKLRELYPEANIDMVKKKINALRTNFRKEQRKVEACRERSKQTGEPLYVPSLWYYELFHFIADQENEMKNNDVDGSIDIQDMLKVDLDENVYFDTDESDENFDEEFQVSSPDSLKPTDPNAHSSQSMSMDDHRSMVPVEYSGFKRKRDINYNSDSSWYTRPGQTSTFVSTPPTPDSHEIFGRYVASKLRKMDKSMQMLSERLISEVLFRGQMGYLNRSTNVSDYKQSVRNNEESVAKSYEDTKNVFILEDDLNIRQ